MGKKEIKDVAVEIKEATVLFGKKKSKMLDLLDKGVNRDQIKSEYGAVFGVIDCSLNVYRGETLVIMGLSGSGKSTLLRAINSLVPLVRGSVIVTNAEQRYEFSKLKGHKLRKARKACMSMVFQNFGLLPWLSVSENVSFGMELSGVPENERQSLVKYNLELMGLTEWGKCKVEELSGGMQQRVGLARAFATKTSILLMDEPYSALDPIIREQLQDELVELKKKEGRTIIFVSHDLDEAVRIGDRIVVMKDGKIVQVGVPQDIIFSPVNDYVTEFVKSANPLKTLRARELVIPFDDNFTFEKHSHENIFFKGTKLKVVKLGSVKITSGHMCVADLYTPVREIVDACLRSKAPVVVSDKGEWVGYIDDRKILHGMLLDSGVFDKI